MNFTAVGTVAILIWGFSLPIGRVVQEEIGPVAYLGTVFLITGLLSLIRQRCSISLRKDEWSHPALYIRWASFVLHEALISISVGIVSRDHMPVVILINYLWPTAIILCSIPIAGIRVYRIAPFLAGTIVVVGSLGYELLGGGSIGSDLFVRRSDNLAYGLTFIGALSWGLYCSVTKRYGAITGEAKPIPLFQLTLGLSLLAAMLPAYSHPWNLSQAGFHVLTAMCAAQALAYYCWDSGMRLGNIIILSLLADFIPWLSLVGTALILGVEISTRTVYSAVCLVIGAIITRYSTRAPPQSSVTG